MTLYVSDLDGTLLADSGKLKPRTADMLARFIAEGTLFSYCTARGLNTAGKLTADLKLAAPVALMNGVFIYDPLTDTCPVRNMFGSRQAELIKKAVLENGETPMIFSIIDGKERVSYIRDSENLKKHLYRRKGDLRMRPLKDYERMFDGEMYYAAFINPVNKPALDSIFTRENGFFHSDYTDTYDPTQNWYEVFSANAGKGNAVLKLKELTGADELVCFGDNRNDIPMFEAADRCYAVGNAVPELKAIADGVIGSNEDAGVPMFIESEIFPVLPYVSVKGDEPDAQRFSRSVEKALARERTTIGTLNEKTVHNALKCYYCDDEEQEKKVGAYFADGVSDNGIFEIQSANFTYLAGKLARMLAVSHVTVVYPFERITRNYAVNESTGEILSVTKRTENSYSKLFLELYRLKAFLTNPNLTVRIAFLELDKKTYYKDSRRVRRRGMKKEKIPEKLLSEIILEQPEDYRVFLPEGLPESFTKAELQTFCRPTEAGIMLSVLEFAGVVRRAGKRGNSIVYEIT